MILIDHHVHIGRDLKTGFYQDASELLSRMNEAEVKKSIIFSCPNVQPSKINPYKKENEEILRSAEKETRFIPFMFIHPYKDSLQYIESTSLFFRGLKIHCSANAMEYSYENLDKSNFFNMIKICDKPIVAHTGLKDGQRARDLIKFAKNYQGILVISHSGRFFSSDLELISEFPNIYLDISPFNFMIQNPKFLPTASNLHKSILSFNPTKIVDYLSSLFSDRLIWGTDSPWCNNLNPKGYIQEINLYHDLHLNERCTSLF